MRKLKSVEVTFRFPNLDTIEKWELSCFSNASFSNLKSRSSQGGFMMFLYSNDKYASIA